MKTFHKVVMVVTVMLTLVSSALAEAVVGEAAPGFFVQDTNGKAHSLADYKGKYVVLEWFNHDCPFVKKHYRSGNMQKLQKEYTQKGVVWLSVSSSAPEKQGHYPAPEANRLTQEKGANPTAVILDSDGTFGHLYDAKTTPHIFVINPEGILIYQGAIDDKPSTDIADVAVASNYVMAALDAAMAGKPVEVSAAKSYGCSVKY